MAQRSPAVRAVWIVSIGWWASCPWASVASIPAMAVVWLPLAFGLLERLPSLTSLYYRLPSLTSLYYRLPDVPSLDHRPPSVASLYRFHA